MKTAAAYFLLCIVAALMPLRPGQQSPAAVADAFPGWSAAPIPDDLEPVQPSARETRFAAGFPGRIGVFKSGARTYVVRWVRVASRKLHPAADCLRAVGYESKPAPIFAEASGERWGVSTATRDSETVRVQERIVDAAGRNWTDVSAWYWSAALGRSQGPWWAVTMIEPSSRPK